MGADVEFQEQALKGAVLHLLLGSSLDLVSLSMHGCRAKREPGIILLEGMHLAMAGNTPASPILTASSGGLPGRNHHFDWCEQAMGLQQGKVWSLLRSVAPIG